MVILSLDNPCITPWHNNGFDVVTALMAMFDGLYPDFREVTFPSLACLRIPFL